MPTYQNKDHRRIHEMIQRKRGKKGKKKRRGKDGGREEEKEKKEHHEVILFLPQAEDIIVLKICTWSEWNFS